jgi:hypothetical protein
LAPFDFFKAAARDVCLFDFDFQRFEKAADEKIDADDNDEFLRGGVSEVAAHGVNQRRFAFDIGSEIIGERETGVFGV